MQTTVEPSSRSVPWQQRLAKLSACSESLDWCKDFPTPEAAWEACTEPRWMAWILGRPSWGCRVHGSPEHKQLALLSCLFARTVLHLVPATPRAQLDQILGQVEGWAWGHLPLTRADLLALRQRAWEIRRLLWRAAADAYADADAAAYAAAYAAVAACAVAACAAAYAAVDADAAADAAADATAADAYWAARAAARQRHNVDLAALIRSAVPCPVI